MIIHHTKHSKNTVNLSQGSDTPLKKLCIFRYYEVLFEIARFYFHRDIGNLLGRSEI